MGCSQAVTIFFFFQAEDGIRDKLVTGVQTCALPISFVNLYEAFASYRDEQLTDQQRREMYEEFLNQKGSMFASHPTVRERMAAVAAFPHALRLENTPALSLFDQPAELEKELSEYLTGYLYAVQQL